MDLESLVKPKGAGNYGFESVREEMLAAQNFYRDLLELRLETLPDSQIHNVRSGAESIAGILTNIQKFNQLQGNPNEKMTNYIEEMRRNWRNAFGNTAPYVAWLKISSSAIANEIVRIRMVEKTVLDHLKRMDVESTEAKEELKRALVAAREASAGAATATQAAEFEREAIVSEKAARLWLAVTVLMLGLAILVTFFAFARPALVAQPPIAQPTNQVALSSGDLRASNSLTPEVLRSLISRVVVVTFLYFGVLWAGKNYAACRHNATVNRHRRNSMQTFLAFREATADQPTRDFILRQAVACAFAPQQSGYLKNETLAEPPAQLIDPARIIGKSD